ncbi:MAG: hypothetical protein H0V63_05005 [Burkholderiaceae bacterium]|nr:hypothetical protein [Burkholderiaceae bacterium]
MLKQKIIGLTAAIALAAGLTACGSSDDGDGGGAPPPAPPSTEVPASASTVAGFFAFLLSLASSETSEPIAVGTFTAPTDDTGEPSTL